MTHGKYDGGTCETPQCLHELCPLEGKLLSKRLDRLEIKLTGSVTHLWEQRERRARQHHSDGPVVYSCEDCRASRKVGSSRSVQSQLRQSSCRFQG